MQIPSIIKKYILFHGINFYNYRAISHTNLNVIYHYNYEAWQVVLKWTTLN